MTKRARTNLNAFHSSGTATEPRLLRSPRGPLALIPRITRTPRAPPDRRTARRGGRDGVMVPGGEVVVHLGQSLRVQIDPLAGLVIAEGDVALDLLGHEPF